MNNTFNRRLPRRCKPMSFWGMKNKVHDRLVSCSMTKKGFSDLPILAVTIAGRVVPRDSLDRSVIDRTGTEKYLRVCPGDIAYNTMRMWQGSCGVVSEEGIISSAYTVLIPHSEQADPNFCRTMLFIHRNFWTGFDDFRQELPQIAGGSITTVLLRYRCEFLHSRNSISLLKHS